MATNKRPIITVLVLITNYSIVVHYTTSALKTLRPRKFNLLWTPSRGARKVTHPSHRRDGGAAYSNESSTSSARMENSCVRTRRLRGSMRALTQPTTCVPSSHFRLRSAKQPVERLRPVPRPIVAHTSTYSSVKFHCWHNLSSKAAHPQANARCQLWQPSPSTTINTSGDFLVVSSRVISSGPESCASPWTETRAPWRSPSRARRPLDAPARAATGRTRC